MLPIICICLPGTRDIRYFQTKLCFAFICPLLITFATKLYLRSRDEHWTGLGLDWIRTVNCFMTLGSGPDLD